ncbi:MAG: sugar transferase [Mangrovimonas sp.]|nr:sugar transferase [Mangrovimonas sp.]HPF97310.1 sugar transferase [Mangrovimonas sp.]HRV55704.1 sugar transferase [Mangrovimonas sp.]
MALNTSQLFIKRLMDILFSSIGLIVLFPLLLVISLIIKLESKGPFLFIQERVGKDNKNFNIFKFRTMYVGSERKGLLTIGDHDPRVTRIGYILRKYKLDEFPQLLNVLLGSMSFVGPRPEVRKYVNLYSQEDLIILSVRPGITSNASIIYRHEVELLRLADNPEEFYAHTILPEKLKLYHNYIENQDLMLDAQIIFKTILVVFK